MSTENKGKTAQEWAEYLPEPIRTQFLDNIDTNYVDYSEYTDSLDDCIISSFSFGDTLEKGQGFIYWDRIHDRALNGEFSQHLPTTPTEVKEESLEEAAKENCEYHVDSLRHLDGFFINAFKDGAKWQLEQMKSKPQPTPTKDGNVTAVEWLVEHWKKLQLEGEKMSWNQVIAITELAKAMEKEQIEKLNEAWVKYREQTKEVSARLGFSKGFDEGLKHHDNYYQELDKTDLIEEVFHKEYIEKTYGG